MMPAKKNPITEEERSGRFIEKARELRAEEETEAFRRAVKKVAAQKAEDESEKT